jgi:geranylgeranyl pyrophosphate synthase
VCTSFNLGYLWSPYRDEVVSVFVRSLPRLHREWWKRIRPVLTLMTTEVLMEIIKALPAAMAVEVFHNFL